MTWNIFQWTCIEPALVPQYNTIQYMYAPLPSSEEVLREMATIVIEKGGKKKYPWFPLLCFFGICFRCFCFFFFVCARELSLVLMTHCQGS